MQPVTPHPTKLVLQKRGCALTVSPTIQLLAVLHTYLHYVLASDRNLELSRLGINCLNAFVQIASLTSYLKCFLKYTGALCKLLYKL